MRNLFWAAATPALLLGLAGCRGCGGSGVVLYCAQDREFAEDQLARFRQSQGIAVTPKFDTEADKSLSLYLEIVKEKGAPRCDVFWNNEIVNTIRLHKQGLLEPYASPSSEGYPAHTRPTDRAWQAFGERARVLLVNTAAVPEAGRPRSLLDLADPKWRGRVVMARPQFGTSSAQAVALFAALGPERAREFYDGLAANKVVLAPGNKQVAEWVAAGKTATGAPVAVGVTDTDDALAEVKRGAPVAMVFPDADRPGDDALGTLFIPNTVSLLKGCANPAGGKQLIDFLLSREVEKALAESDSHQMPLHPDVKAELPEALRPAAKAHRMRVNWEEAADRYEEVQRYLNDRFARGP